MLRLAEHLASALIRNAPGVNDCAVLGKFVSEVATRTQGGRAA